MSSISFDRACRALRLQPAPWYVFYIYVYPGSTLPCSKTNYSSSSSKAVERGALLKVLGYGLSAIRGQPPRLWLQYVLADARGSRRQRATSNATFFSLIGKSFFLLFLAGLFPSALSLVVERTKYSRMLSCSPRHPGMYARSTYEVYE